MGLRYSRSMTWPPSSGMTAPVMNAASGLSSSVIHTATSCGAPIRPSGTWLFSHLYASSRSSAQVAWMGVSIGPGAMQLILTPIGASSPASVWVR